MVDNSVLMAAQAVPSSTTPVPELRNRLANSSSPYLRAHRDNPVAWQEWNAETLRLARQLDRLIFLSVGYNACHWCHVMERESFVSPEVASVLNTSFVPVKVDRESRPDIDEIYMSYVTATTGSGGWPLNVFLTPALQPVFGGTYWPGPPTRTPASSRRGSVEAETPLTFPDVLLKMRHIWSTQRDRCLDSAQDITNQLRAFASEGSQQQAPPSESSDEEPLDLDLLDDALDHFVSRYDAKYGGFTPNAPRGPKFPNPPNLTFLLRLGASIAYPSTHTRFGFPAPVPGILGKESCAKAATIALHTLLSISRSGMRDQLGFGFHRYSVTPDWNLPHFEKMLPDNALLMACYCDAWALNKDPEILGTIYNLVEYFTNPSSPVVHSEGGWYASEDADSIPSRPSTPASGLTNHEKKEGAFYAWTFKEFQSILGNHDAMVLARHFGVKADGNVAAEHDVHDEFLTQNILHIAATPSTLAKEFGLSEDEIVKIIKSGRSKLAAYRDSQRARPEVDTKIIASWNGLAITALARAANTLADIDKERSKRCVEAAQKAAQFIRDKLYDEEAGKLSRVFTSRHEVNGDHLDGGKNENTGPAFLDDYAYMTLACLALFDLTFHQPYLDWAVQLQDHTIQHFLAENGGFYLSPSTTQDDSGTDDPKLPLNLKTGSDTALPSPNGILATNLFYLAGYLDTMPSCTSSDPEKSTKYLTYAHRTLSSFSIEMLQHPFLFPSLLSALVMQAVGVRALTVPRDMREREVRKLRGWGRTVVKRDDMEPGKVMICLRNVDDDGKVGGGICRELKEGELDDVDFDEHE